MLSWIPSLFKKDNKEEKGDPKEEKKDDGGMFSFGSKMAYKKQAVTKKPTDYDFLFKILMVGDSGECDKMKFQT